MGEGPYITLFSRSDVTAFHRIKDELHFLCVCPVYSNHRNILLNEIILSYNNFSNLDITEKFCFIMATGRKCVLNFVENA